MPVLKGFGKEKTHLILVIDTSAGMQTLVSEDGTTRLDLAKEQACALIDEAANGSQFTIISCASLPELAASAETSKTTAKQSIRSLTATDCYGTLAPAVSYCQSYLEGQNTKGRCAFFTDSSVDTGSLAVDIYPVNARENEESPMLTRDIGIRYAFLSPDSSGKTASLSCEFTVQTPFLANHEINDWPANDESKSETADVKLYINGELTAVSTCIIYEASAVLSATDTGFQKIQLPDTNEPLLIKVELCLDDALPGNNIYYQIHHPDGQTEQNILLVSKQNSFLENSLNYFTQTQSAAIYKINDIDDYDPSVPYSVTIFDGLFPKKLPESGSLLLFPDGTDLKGSLESFEKLLEGFSATVNKKGSFVSMKSSWLELTNIEDFFVSRFLSMQLPGSASSLFHADTTETPACYMTRKNGQLITVFGFDLHDTDFPLTTDFPIFIYDFMVNNLTWDDFSNSYSYRCGEEITYYPVSTGSRVTVLDEQGNTALSFTPSSPIISDITLEKSGIYDFYTKESDKHAYTACNFCSGKSEDSIDIFDTPVFPNQTEPNQATEGLSKSSLPLVKILTVLCICLLLLEFALWLRAAWNKKGRRMFGIMRLCLILLLILSLPDLHISFGSGRETTLFVVDVSDSMSGNMEEISNTLTLALKNLPKGTRAGIIAFGSDARVEQFISHDIHFNGMETTPISGGTNIENAIKTAVSMFPSGDRARMILLTDGMENEGRASDAASLLSDHRISLKVLSYSHNSQDEVLISSVKVPTKLTVGDDFQTQITVESNTATDAVLSLYSGDTLMAKKDVSLTPGTNRFVFKDTLKKSGLTSYRAVIEPVDDTETVNNEYITFTQAEEAKEILLIEGKRGEAAAFEKLLAAANIPYHLTQPQTAPKDLIRLKHYSSIILENVHADDLSSGFLSIVQAYVNDGGGLIAIGGDNSFALGNYPNSPLEDILPVNSELEGENQTEETAMALVIDHSSSMDAGDSHYSRLRLAKEAAVSALDTLRETDSIGVLAFNDSYDWVVPFTKVGDEENKDSISRSIAGIQINGGTSIYPAVKEAVNQLKEQDTAKYKHIILLTDGEDGFTQYKDLYEKMEDENITLSTVAVSEGADTKLLQSMAENGGGRYYYTDISTDIPRIFAQEVYLSKDSYLINKPFDLTITGREQEIAQCLFPENENPIFQGYIATSLKYTASSILESDASDPILALQQYGLGVTAAFTSDVTGEWSREFSGKTCFADFWKKLIRRCSSPSESKGEGNLTVTAQAGKADFTYQYDIKNEYDRQHRSFIAQCTGEDGSTFTVPLSASENGIFKGSAQLPDNQAYTVSITCIDPFSSALTTSETMLTSAFASTYSREYQLYNSEDTTIDELIRQTNAQIIEGNHDFYTGELAAKTAARSLTTIFLLLAAFLFLIDIAMRRFGIPKIPAIKINRKPLPLSNKQPNKQNQEPQNNQEIQAEHQKTMKKRKPAPKKKKEQPELLDTSQLLKSRRKG